MQHLYKLNNNMCCRFTIFLTIELMLVGLVFSEDLSCKLDSTPVVFGQNLNITCELRNASSCMTVAGGRAWFRGSDTLFFNGFPRKHMTRYKEIEDTCNRYILNVANISEDDINTQFRCSYDKNDCFITTDLQTILPEYHPKHDDIRNITNISTDSVSIELEILKVYPLPNCSLIKGEAIIQPIKINVSRNGFYYWSYNVYKYTLDGTECHVYININCLVGSTVLRVLDGPNHFCSETIEDKSIVTFIIQYASSPLIIFIILLSIYRNWPLITKLINEPPRRKCWGWRRPVLGLVFTGACVVTAVINGTVTTELVFHEQTTESLTNVGNGCYITSLTLMPLALCFLSNPGTEGIRDGTRKAFENFKKKVIWSCCIQHRKPISAIKNASEEDLKDQQEVHELIHYP